MASAFPFHPSSFILHPFMSRLSLLTLLVLPLAGLALPPASQQYALLIRAKETPRGLLVTAIGKDGPAAKLVRADDPSVKGKLESGDLITHIGGSPIRTVEDARAALARSARDGGRVLLRVESRGRAVSWRVQAHRLPRAPEVAGRV